jgi:hypothetical protein
VRLLGDADEFRVVSLHEFEICVDRRTGMIESIFNTPLYRGFGSEATPITEALLPLAGTLRGNVS